MATKWLRLAMETDEERKARLEKMVATKRLVGHGDMDKVPQCRLLTLFQEGVHTING